MPDYVDVCFACLDDSFGTASIYSSFKKKAICDDIVVEQP